ncbi:MAG: hypothetical protein HY907_17360 [Deltaproteobacteria bacterium]|nr:hypothetical protein [Deltaproteobacteria bacterium]
MVARFAWLVALAASAGCVGTAVDVLERAETGGDADGDGGSDGDGVMDDGPGDDAADAAEDAAEDAPEDGGDASGCRPDAGDCPAGERCDVRGCGAGATGTCVPAPADCTADWNPVCACDGKSYWNDCERLAAEAARSGDGACATGNCIPWPLGECASDEVCAWIGCLPSALGTCVARPSSCAAGGADTCACDGVTYANPCAALDTGMPMEHAGACTSRPCTPVCETVSGGGTAWRNPCTDTTICEADCTGCPAFCLAGTLIEGWYAYCFRELGHDGGCRLWPTLIEFGPCGS